MIEDIIELNLLTTQIICIDNLRNPNGSTGRATDQKSGNVSSMLTWGLSNFS